MDIAKPTASLIPSMYIRLPHVFFSHARLSFPHDA